MNLSNRLQKIASLVPNDVPAADIGADHGLLISYLIKNHIIPYGYASDNKKGPYENLTSRIKDEHLSSKIETSLCDGISNCNTKKYKTLIICGMGGDLIKNIIKNDEEKAKNATFLLLSPQGCEFQLREYLLSIGFYPEKEEIVFEDHFYEILLFSKNKKELGELDLKYGYFLRREKSDVFKEKYISLIKINEHILSNNLLVQEKRESLLKQNEEYYELIKE